MIYVIHRQNQSGCTGSIDNFLRPELLPNTHGAEYQTKTYRRRERGSCKSPRSQKNCKLLITRDMQNCNLLGEAKLVPPSKSKNANYLSIKHIYLRVVRGDFLERRGGAKVTSTEPRTTLNTNCLAALMSRVKKRGASEDRRSILPRESRE